MRGERTRAVNGIVNPPEPVMHAVHSPLHLLLLPRVVPLAEERQLGVDGQALARRVLEARLVEVEDGDLGAALARKGEGYLTADAYVGVRCTHPFGKMKGRHT